MGKRVQAHTIETVRFMTSPPDGESSAISDGSLREIIEGAKSAEGTAGVVQMLVACLGFYAKHYDAWVGIAVPALADEIGVDPGVNFTLMHPSIWEKVNPGHPLIGVLRDAQEQGLITLDDGFMYPTQLLSDQLLAASS